MAVTKAPCIIAMTAEGGVLATTLAKNLQSSWHGLARRTAGADVEFDHAGAHIRELFLAGHPIIGICGAGILIRTLSGHLRDKRSDPPVIAVSDDGQVVVPLLGGHHGGNKLARQVAASTGGVVALTTAGDLRLKVALDEPPAPFVLGSDGDAVKNVMARLLDGAGVQLNVLIGDDPALFKLTEQWRDWLSPLCAERGGDDVSIALSFKPHEKVDADLVFHPQIGCLGLGASRECPSDEMTQLVANALDEAGIARNVVRGVYSVDLKSAERAILDVADEFDARLQVFTSARLERETPRLQNPSQIVFNEVGCHGVCEAAALAAAGADGILILPKQISAHATVAVALDPTGEYQTQECRYSGRVMLVGIGPGQSEWRTPEASAMIAAADELVGYGLYIDMLGAVAHGKRRRDFTLGEEEVRCRYALETAGKGFDIAIICSGDAGIYAMGALVFELLARPASEGGVSDAAQRVLVETAPGISALQAAAARTGAILGHDFCTISLSDLLTPWDVIEKRIKAAAEGDFVIAFYNPVSKRRQVGLAKARDILLKYRSADTPVVLATNLGRAEETIKHRTLSTLNTDEVDMLTVVMVGSTSSLRIDHLGGRRAGGKIVFTPRGYANKRGQS